jgi:pyruvate-ferredoxin/flavodoxin oxidoreductase
VLRGTAQNPDVFFQAREACNLYYALPRHRAEAMDRFAEQDGAPVWALRLRRRIPRPSA